MRVSYIKLQPIDLPNLTVSLQNAISKVFRPRIRTGAVLGISLMTTCVVLFAPAVSLAQLLPKEMRGYKVYDAGVAVDVVRSPHTDVKKNNDVVEILRISVADVGLSGLSLFVDATLKTSRSGQIDLVAFRDFTVDGVPVTVEEYGQKLSVSRNIVLRLPKPVIIHLSTANMARAAYKELTSSKRNWEIKGTAIVFGNFRKFAWTFKRAVVVSVSISMPNPLTPP